MIGANGVLATGRVATVNVLESARSSLPEMAASHAVTSPVAWK